MKVNMGMAADMGMKVNWGTTVHLTTRLNLNGTLHNADLRIPMRWLRAAAIPSGL